MIREEQIEHAFNRRHCIAFSPVPQARHRYVYLNSPRMQIYDPNARAKLYFKAEVMRHLSELFGISDQDYPLTTSYVSVDVTFMISRPDNHFVGNNRDRGIRPDFEHTSPTAQGDIDNFMKFFLDAIKGIFYNDDRNVIASRATKLFTTDPNGRYVFYVRHCEMEIVNLIENNE